MKVVQHPNSGRGFSDAYGSFGQVEADAKKKLESEKAASKEAVQKLFAKSNVAGLIASSLFNCLSERLSCSGSKSK